MDYGVQIGGINVKFHFHNRLFYILFRKRYKDFQSDINQFDYRVNLFVKRIGKPKEDYFIMSNGRTIEFFQRDYMLYYNVSKKEFKIELDERYLNYDSPFFPFMRALFLILLNDVEGCLLHSSSIFCDGKVFCFTGPQGAGKTTLAIKSKKPILNDENSLIRIVNGDVFCYGNNLGGTRGLSFRKTKAKLKTIFFIRKSRSNNILKIPLNEALPKLMKNDFFFIYFRSSPYMKKYVARQFRILSKLLSKVQVYYLNANKDFTFSEFKVFQPCIDTTP